MTDGSCAALPHAAEVLIVGMGPVGKLLAIQLGRQGHTVVVADRNSANYPLPRAVTHCSDVARILQSVGLGPDRIPHITEPFDGMYSWRNGAGELLFDVDWGGRGESGWHNTYFFHQPDLERAFDDILADLPSVTILRCWQAVSVSQNECTATVGFESTRTGLSTTITADWVIGADGANSTIRRLLNIQWRDEGYFCDWLVVDVRLHDSARPFPRVASQRCDPDRPSTMVPAGPGRRRWEFMRLPDETREELDCADTAWRLLQQYGVTPDNAELQRYSVYTFQSCRAPQWRDGRVLLAGDSAHLMPPFAGQGLGAGLRDVHNLSWKLSAILRGVASEPLLDTYSSERQQHADAFIHYSTTLGRVICVTDPHQANVRDRRIARSPDSAPPTVPPRPSLGPGLHVGPVGGTVARQGRVRLASTTRPAMFDDVIGGAGAVISRTSGPLDRLDARWCAALNALNMALVALTGTSSRALLVDDVDGLYSRWLEEIGADTIIVRPDFHVFGTALGDDTESLVMDFLTAAGAPIANWTQ